MKSHAVKHVVLASILILSWASSAQTSRTYTKDADFDEGILSGLNHTAPKNNQLQISTTEPAVTDPYLWVANYAQGRVTKVDTRSGKQVGMYDSVLMRNWDGSTPPVPAPRSGCNSPSRTTVDGDGNAFVANRGLCDATGAGSIASLTKIAGTLGYCVDHNGNGTLDTSHDADADGVINPSDPKEFFGQSDECLLWTKTYAAPGDLGRSVAVDADQNLWVGGFSSSKLYKLDGKTGELLKVIDPSAETKEPANIYGIAIGPKGFIYTSALEGRLLRKIDPNAPEGSRVASILSPVPTYGIAVDSRGIVWLGNWSANPGGVVRVDFVAGKAELLPIPASEVCKTHTRGVAVDHRGDVWVACYNSTGLNSRLLRYDSSGTFRGSYPTENGALGVAIDSQLRVWTSNQSSDTVTRVVDTRTDPPTPVSQSHPAGGPPYSYWDMTGFQHRSFTWRQGEWIIVHDSSKSGTKWGTLHWNREPQGSIPADTKILVSARAADTEAALDSQRFYDVNKAESFTGKGVAGRYLQLKVVLRTKNLDVSPVLSDLTVIPSWSWSAPVSMCHGPVSTDGKPDTSCSHPIYHRAVLLKDGKVFIVGGFTGAARIFDPSTATWRDTTSASVSRQHHTATLLPDGRVLVTGGVDGSPNSAVDLYDPTSNTWSRAVAMKQARSHHTATLLADGRVLVVGGTAPASTTAELYNRDGTWVSTGNLSQGRRGHTATLLADGRVLVVGGVDDSENPLASAEIYNPVTGTWSMAASLNQTRYEHTATLMGESGLVLVTGNRRSSSDADSAEVYNPATNTWSLTGKMANKRSMHAATLLRTGQVLVSGGFHSFDKGILREVELYDPSTGSWTPVGSMTFARYQHTLTLLNNGEVLAIGGIGNAIEAPFTQTSSEVLSP